MKASRLLERGPRPGAERERQAGLREWTADPMTQWGQSRGQLDSRCICEAGPTAVQGVAHGSEQFTCFWYLVNVKGAPGWLISEASSAGSLLPPLPLLLPTLSLPNN